MKRALILILALGLLFAATTAAFASECGCEFDSGEDFGLHHADMAVAGMLGADMNPGMHQGYSIFAP